MHIASDSLALEMLNAPQTLEISINHDGYPCAQCFTLFHTVRKRERIACIKVNPILYLCDVSMTLLPSLTTPINTSHRNLLVAGSIPVVGSSNNKIGGLPTSATAVLNFLLLPPLIIIIIIIESHDDHVTEGALLTCRSRISCWHISQDLDGLFPSVLIHVSQAPVFLLVEQTLSIVLVLLISQ